MVEEHITRSVKHNVDSIFRFRRSEVNGAVASTSKQDTAIRQVEIPLTFDSEFFGIIHGDVSILDGLQAQEQEMMTQNIRALGSEISKVANPSKHSKSDINQWRALFDLYLQAGIFFSTNELDHGSRNAAVAMKQLQWFQMEVTKRKIAKSFKLASSRDALKRFMGINLTLLRNIKFQEINQLAISKILKSMLFPPFS
jgi:E3 ubiquitin-protein ligase BAH